MTPAPARSARPPYALAPTDFPLPALAAMAGQAALGGPRELALACFVVCRGVSNMVRGIEEELTAEQRRTRAHGTRQWLAAAAIPAPVRAALGRLVDAIAGMDRKEVAEAMAGVIAVTATRLESPARLELARLAQDIED